jgi:hypothetical protein
MILGMIERNRAAAAKFAHGTFFAHLPKCGIIQLRSAATASKL